MTKNVPTQDKILMLWIQQNQVKIQWKVSAEFTEATSTKEVPGKKQICSLESNYEYSTIHIAARLVNIHNAPAIHAHFKWRRSVKFIVKAYSIQCKMQYSPLLKFNPNKEICSTMCWVSTISNLYQYFQIICVRLAP